MLSSLTTKMWSIVWLGPTNYMFWLLRTSAHLKGKQLFGYVDGYIDEVESKSSTNAKLPPLLLLLPTPTRIMTQTYQLSQERRCLHRLLSPPANPKASLNVRLSSLLELLHPLWNTLMMSTLTPVPRTICARARTGSTRPLFRDWYSPLRSSLPMNRQSLLRKRALSSLALLSATAVRACSLRENPHCLPMVVNIHLNLTEKAARSLTRKGTLLPQPATAPPTYIVWMVAPSPLLLLPPLHAPLMSTCCMNVLATLVMLHVSSHKSLSRASGPSQVHPTSAKLVSVENSITYPSPIELL